MLRHEITNTEPCKKNHRIISITQYVDGSPTYYNSCHSDQSLSYALCTQALAASFWAAPCTWCVLENRFPIDNDTNNLNQKKVSYNTIDCRRDTCLDKCVILEKFRGDSTLRVLEQNQCYAVVCTFVRTGHSVNFTVSVQEPEDAWIFLLGRRVEEDSGINREPSLSEYNAGNTFDYIDDI